MPRWTDRQVGMLREMGVQHFWPPEPEAAPQPAAVAAAGSRLDLVAPEAGHAPTSAAIPPATAAAVAIAPPRPTPPVAREPFQTVSAALASATPELLGKRPEGVASMDWPELRQTVAGCVACGLCKGRRQTVFGVGHEQARWMIIGEAPGEQEDKRGEPFVGRAGQLLDRMLMAVGLTRAEDSADQQVYIANVIKCRPPGNRNPLPEEVAQCEPYLVRQVQLVQPRLILAMGRFAVQSILRSSEPIGKLRGRVHEYQGVPVVVTYHPAYLLRNPADKALSWDDLCLAREVLARQG